MARITTAVALLVALQACVVTAEKKIVVPQDTSPEDTTPPADIVTDSDPGDSLPPEDLIAPPREEWEIGPEGGTFLFHGGVRLVVPPGAFAAPITVLVGLQDGGEGPEGVTAITGVWIIPDLEGIEFNHPVILVLPLLDPLPTLPGDVTWDQLGGFTRSLEGDTWEKLPASVDLTRGELQIVTMHFSMFLGGLGGGSTSCTPADETCNGQDDDCDASIDEGACGAGEPCFLGSMCGSGTCTWVQGGTGAVCAATPGGCAIQDDAMVAQLEEGTLLCAGVTTYRLCEAGLLSEPEACEDGFPGTFLCDAEAGECGGECSSDADCPDPDLCDGDTVCTAGKCVPDGAPVECPAATTCKSWACVPATGTCQGTPINQNGVCDDGDPCTIGEKCAAGTCGQGTAKNCADTDPCTEDSCQPGTGNCLHETAPLVNASCNDQDACTSGDKCSAQGVCAGTPAVTCDDDNDCTMDSCDPSDGLCDYVPLGAGLPCDYPATGSPAAACYPDAACNVQGVCQGGASVCECLADTDCVDDGNKCNGVPSCELGAFPYVCEEGAAVQCPAATQCSNSACVPATGLCQTQAINTGQSCNDGSVCTSEETCSQGQCSGGILLDCVDDDPCTADSCDPVNGCQHPAAPAAPCNDNDTCTTDDCAPDGLSCIFLPIVGCCQDSGDCPGGVPCVAGTCCSPSCGPAGEYECGSDGCGGSCGTCQGSETCNEETHVCVCASCCQDSSECSSLQVCYGAGGGDPVCTTMTKVFQASFEGETAGEPSPKFTYSWPSYSPGWTVYNAAAAPDFAYSQPQSLRYNKYKSNGWMEFSASLTAGKSAWLSMMVRCPVPPNQNWSLVLKGDGNALKTVGSGSVCGASAGWNRVTQEITSLGGGSHTFRFELTNNDFGTIYLDDVAVLQAP